MEIESLSAKDFNDKSDLHELPTLAVNTWQSSSTEILKGLFNGHRASYQSELNVPVSWAQCLCRGISELVETFREIKFVAIRREPNGIGLELSYIVQMKNKQDVTKILALVAKIKKELYDTIITRYGYI